MFVIKIPVIKNPDIKKISTPRKPPSKILMSLKDKLHGTELQK